MQAIIKTEKAGFSLTAQESIKTIAYEFTQNPKHTLAKRLKAVDKTVDEFLELCQNSSLPDEIIRSSIYLYLLPSFPQIVRKITESAAKKGDPQAIRLSMELLGRFSKLLARFGVQGPQQHLHFHLAQKDPESLREEALYQVKKLISLELELPDGKQRVAKLLKDVFREQKQRAMKMETISVTPAQASALLPDDLDDSDGYHDPEKVMRELD